MEGKDKKIDGVKKMSQEEVKKSRQVVLEALASAGSEVEALLKVPKKIRTMADITRLKEKSEVKAEAGRFRQALKSKSDQSIKNKARVEDIKKSQPATKTAAEELLSASPDTEPADELDEKTKKLFKEQLRRALNDSDQSDAAKLGLKKASSRVTDVKAAPKDKAAASSTDTQKAGLPSGQAAKEGVGQFEAPARTGMKAAPARSADAEVPALEAEKPKYSRQEIDQEKKQLLSMLNKKTESAADKAAVLPSPDAISVKASPKADVKSKPEKAKKHFNLFAFVKQKGETAPKTQIKSGPSATLAKIAKSGQGALDQSPKRPEQAALPGKAEKAAVEPSKIRGHQDEVLKKEQASPAAPGTAAKPEEKKSDRQKEKAGFFRRLFWPQAQEEHKGENLRHLRKDLKAVHRIENDFVGQQAEDGALLEKLPFKQKLLPLKHKQPDQSGGKQDGPEIPKKAKSGKIPGSKPEPRLISDKVSRVNPFANDYVFDKIVQKEKALAKTEQSQLGPDKRQNKPKSKLKWSWFGLFRKENKDKAGQAKVKGPELKTNLKSGTKELPSSEAEAAKKHDRKKATVKISRKQRRELKKRQREEEKFARIAREIAKKEARKKEKEEVMKARLAHQEQKARRIEAKNALILKIKRKWVIWRGRGRRMCKQMLALSVLVFVIGIFLYSVFLFTVLRFELDSPGLRSISRFLPVPALISEDGIIPYFDYVDAKTELAQTTPAPVSEKQVRIFLIEDIIINKLMDDYGLSIIAGESRIAAKERLAAVLAFDHNINFAPWSRISRIQTLLDNNNFAAIADQYGDDRGQLTLDREETGQNEYYSDLFGLAVGENSRIITAPEGYYIYRCYDKDSRRTYLSYLFIAAVGLDEYLAKEVNDYKLWSLVK